MEDARAHDASAAGHATAGLAAGGAPATHPEGPASPAGPAAGLPRALGFRLGFLLKHTQAQLARAAAGVLEPYGIDGRELTVLAVLADEYPLSQQDAAGLLNIDRTTMVALIDGLEGKGLVARRRSPGDRRKNVIDLTPAGHDCLREAGRARDDVERRFLAPLGDAGAREFVRALRVLTTAPPTGAVPGGRAG